MGREKPSNNPVGPTVETETGLNPQHNSATELPQLIATANVHYRFHSYFLAGDRGTAERAVTSVAMQRCRPLYGE